MTRKTPISLGILTAVMLAWLPAVAEEPVVLTGTWVGTWWMGKYEEPIELHLTQANTGLVGRVTLWGYPISGVTGIAAPVQAAIEGTVEGPRVRLGWTTPEQGQFWVELTVQSPDTLFGVGGAERISTGFELRRTP
ncbi:MAG TPA: hypothetical protein VID04_18935 [Methylomirabilota bacterium]